MTASSPAELLAAVRKVDPQGTWAMAAIQSDAGVIALDSARLATLTTWNGDGLGLSVGDAAKKLHPPAGPSLIVHGHLTMTAKAVSKHNRSGLTMGVQVVAPDGTVSVRDLGSITPQARTVTVQLPGCESGCVFGGFVVNLDAPIVDGAPLEGSTQLTVSDVRDARGPVDLTLCRVAGGAAASGRHLAGRRHEHRPDVQRARLHRQARLARTDIGAPRADRPPTQAIR